MQLKVLSWNIWGGQYLPQVVDFLKESNADIIGLQEVSQDPGGANNVAEVIGKQLGYRWVYGAIKRLKASEIGWKSEKTMEWGNAILARHEIIENKNHQILKNFPQKKNPGGGGFSSAAPGRGAVRKMRETLSDTDPVSTPTWS